MNGCRKLSEEEIQLLKQNLSTRDRCIFVIGIRTGFRIGEVLSLQVTDVINNDGSIKNEIYLKKKNTKGSLEGRVVPMHVDIMAELVIYLSGKQNIFIGTLFPVNKSTYHRSIKRACVDAGISAERISSHATRKTFAANMYKAVDGNIWKIQKALGHRSINSTAKYIDVDAEEVFNIIKNMK